MRNGISRPGVMNMIRLFASRFGRLLLGVWVIMLITSAGGLNLVPAASKHQGSSSSTSTLTLVLLDSTDGLPHWGQDVTFTVSTTATSTPYVNLDCYQNGTLVYGATAGFFPSYPWPGSQIMPLSSPSWTSGAASCTATLWYPSGKKDVTLTTLNFQVYA